MKSALAAFMGIAFTAIIIVALVFGKGGGTMKTETTKYNTNVTEQKAPTVSEISTP